MAMNDPNIYQKKLVNFSKSVFKACKDADDSTNIIVLAWKNANDRKALLDVAKHLQGLQLIQYTAGFSSLKLTVTPYGKRRLKKYDDWYD